MSAEELEYYAQAGRLTSYDDDVLAAEIDAAARVVQGVVLHEGWASRYGSTSPPTVGTRSSCGLPPTSFDVFARSIPHRSTKLGHPSAGSSATAGRSLP